jgi:steroid 5-alpha reductase family enzyme
VTNQTILHHRVFVHTFRKTPTHAHNTLGRGLWRTIDRPNFALVTQRFSLD